jgi:DNA-directed RNA polymerase II subunit RPB2
MLHKNTSNIFDAYFKSTREYSVFVQSHIESYDRFINVELPDLIKRYNPITTTVTGGGNTQVRAEINFNDVRTMPPSVMTANNVFRPITPNYCRNKNSSYTSDVFANYSLKIFLKEGNKPEMLWYKYDSTAPLRIGKIPCMIMSKYCNLRGLSPENLRAIKEDTKELGSYFIIKGGEFIIIPQENKTPNKIYKNIDIKSKNIEYSCWIQSKITNSYTFPYYTTVIMNHKNEIFVSVSISKAKQIRIPLGIFMRALGVKTDKQIHNLIAQDSNDIASILAVSLMYKWIPKSGEKYYPIITTRQAMLFIGGKLKESTYHKKLEKPDAIVKYVQYKLLEEEFLPHICGNQCTKRKLYFIANMVRSVIKLSLGTEMPLDRDNYGNKRILTSGILFGQLFRHNFNSIINKELRPFLRKKMESFNKEERYDTLVLRGYSSRRMLYMERQISTGLWPAGQTKDYNVKAGVSQNFERKSRLDSIMFTQKIIMSTKSKGKTESPNPEIRKLHQSQLGVFDPFDTPDGKNIGKIKHKTMLSYITNYISPKIIYTLFESDQDNLKSKVVPLELQNPKNLPYTGKIFINGDWVYCTERHNLKDIWGDLIYKRRMGIIDPFITIIVDYETFEIRIWSDAGRLLRPLYIVSPGNKLNITKNTFDGLEKGKYDWKHLIKHNYIEYVFIHEARYNCYIANTERDLKKDPKLHPYTHCEISPLAILSVNSASIPYANYNQGPRIVFQCQLQKQSAGMYATNHATRIDTAATIFSDAQLPLVSSIINKYTGMEEMPAGTNAIIAVTTYTGFNIEDSVIVNERSAKNGFMDVFVYKVKSDMVNSGIEEFEKPKKNKTEHYKEYSSYDAIGRDGLPKRGKIVNNGDVIIGKVKLLSRTYRQRSYNRQFEYQDRSKVYEELDSGTVEKVTRNPDAEGNDVVKVKLRLYRQLKVGDKVSSVSAQKGTVSIIMKPEDMPYTSDGIIPDIIFNPHGYISRMTIAQIIIMARSLIAAEKGVRFDATPFNNINITRDIVPELQRLGYKYNGDTTMYNGFTGEPMQAKIFVAPLYYQRLKHMVNDKVSARDLNGYYSPKTRQPSKGRTKKGGFRVGSMEKDAMIGHGAVYILKEKFYDHSDKFKCYVSKDTGFICAGNPKKYIYKDNGQNKNIVQVQLPWCFVYLWTLLTTIGISVKFEV